MCSDDFQSKKIYSITFKQKTMTKIFLLAALILFSSCGDNSYTSAVHHPGKLDSALTTIVYKYAPYTIRIDGAKKYLKDTFAFDTIDSENAKRVWKKDSIYLGPVFDSLGRMWIDSLTRQPIFIRPIKKEDVLADFNKYP